MKNENLNLSNGFPFKHQKSYNDNNNLQQNCGSKKILTKNNLLNILISIFYYEKSVLENYDENSFILDNSFLLINSDWIYKFKEYYNYKEFSHFLAVLSNNNSFINFNNLNEYIDEIIQYFLDQNFEEKEISLDLFKYKIESGNNNYYIIHSKIMYLSHYLN